MIDDHAIIIDGMTVVHELKGHGIGTMADLGKEFMKAVERKNRYCDTIREILDRYDMIFFLEKQPEVEVEELGLCYAAVII